MFKKWISIMVLTGLLSLGSLTAFADHYDEDSSWKDSMMRSIENGDGGIQILKNYHPKNKVPFVSFSAPYDTKNISMYLDEQTEHSQKVCEICKQPMIYTDILYEINPLCGHGIFSHGHYCAKDDIFVPEHFYTQCGCEKENIKQIHPYMQFVKEYLK